MDKALATVLATPSAEDRYFIGEALFIGTVLFVLNRYAGAYLDELGIKPLAKQHADATRDYLAKIRAKKIEPSDGEAQQKQLQLALTAIEERGASPEAARAAEETLAKVLVDAGAINAQARETAHEVTVVVQAIVRRS
ncbi:hypothetical protein CR492_16775 [Methylocella silvestris]|uniref:Uncharacterized protein n=2 Tax=Methylocella silvestris TaxID=199596 RepID=A0A2J7TDD4_METSI|nr:hypothetical protein CR492_16775 [Methylocella silvestris]